MATQCAQPGDFSDVDFARQELFLGCGEPLDHATCVALDGYGIVNAMCAINTSTYEYQDWEAWSGTGDPPFAWANPNDDCSDDEGIETALTRAGVTKTVFLPAGAPDLMLPGLPTQPYRVEASIDVGSHRLVGSRVSNNMHGTRIAVQDGFTLAPTDASCDSLPLVAIANPSASCGPGAVIRAKNKIDIESLVIEAGAGGGTTGSAAYGIYAHSTHGGRIDRVVSKDASSVGMYLEHAGTMQISDVTIDQSGGDGLWTAGLNGSNVRTLRSTHNARHGVVVTPDRPSGGGHTGEISFFGGNIEQNDGHGFYVYDATGTYITGFRVEGNDWDGFHVAEAQNVSIIHNRVQMGPYVADANFPGESLYHPFTGINTSSLTLADNVTDGGGVNRPNQEDIWLVNVRHAEVRNNLWMGSGVNGVWDQASATEPMVTKIVTGTTVESLFHAPRSNFWAHDAPTGGKWRTGDVIWNRSPAVNEPAGWMCRHTTPYGYDCTEWLSFGTLSAIP
ncbi:MAG: right-handed parallel beta-helix repeat-containing protein [Myxococcota bacterium]